MSENNPRPIPALERPHKLVWRKLLKTTEGHILLLGIAIALAGLVIMGIVAFWSPQTSRIMGTMGFADITLGTIVSMSIGYAAGYGHAVVIPVNMWAETVMLLLFYPIFVFSVRKLVVIPRLRNIIARTQAAAELNHDKVRRYGAIGLFVFVWFPFWMTGPLVGGAIGYLLNFPAWLTLSVVLAGTLFTMLTWAFVLFGLFTHAAAFGHWAPALIIGILVLVVLIAYLLNRRGKNRKQKIQREQN